MRKTVSIILLGLIFISNSISQQKTFGYKTLGSMDIISDAFFISEGIKLDSVFSYINDKPQIFRFEYYPDGKLKRDYNYMSFQEYLSGREKSYPAYREYVYSEKENSDSIFYFYWSDSGKVEKSGYKIKYEYNDEDQLYTKTYSGNTGTYRIEEYTYNNNGNLIQLKKNLPKQNYTENSYWEYDSQYRLILRKTVEDTPNPSWTQYIYEYNDDGTIDCTQQQVNEDTTIPIMNFVNYNFQFDEEDRSINQTISSSFNYDDSTWMQKFDVPMVYDDNGRIIDIDEYHLDRFFYNDFGNLDSLYMLAINHTGYLSNRFKIADSFGNTITFPENFGKFYFYYSSPGTGTEENNSIDSEYSLSQNYPNPFNPTTTISYSIPQSSYVTIKLYDLLGREINTLVNGQKSPGNYKVTFNGSGLASGFYFYRLQSGSFSETKKFALMK